MKRLCHTFSVKSKSINRTYAGTRKHHHFRVTVTYSDGEKSVSGKVFNNRENADRYAARQIFLPTDVRQRPSTISPDCARRRPKLRTWVQSFIPRRSIVSIHTVRCRLEEESDTLKVSHAVRHSRRLAIRAAKLGPKPTFYLDLSW